MPYTFTARSNGQTIDASHVNELQTAITVTTKRVYNVVEHGATGDGSTNDTTAIQAAIDAAATAGGGVIEFPAGTYMVNQIVIKTRCHLVGAGHKTTILKLRANRNEAVLKSYTSPDNITSNAYWWSVSHLGIDGNRANQSSSSSRGIEVIMSPLWTQATNDPDFDPDFRIQCVTVQYCKGSGVYLRGRSQGQLYGVWCDDNDEHGYHLDQTSDTNFTGCVASMSGKDGWLVDTSASCSWSNCKAYWNGRLTGTQGYGWEITTSSHEAMLSSCLAQDNKSSGFLCSQSNGCVLAACVADSNSNNNPGDYPGFYIWNSSYVQMHACTSMDRLTSYFHSGQTCQEHAISIRTGGGSIGYNVISITHYGRNSATVGTPLDDQSDGVVTPGTNVWLNGIRCTSNRW